MDWVIYPFFSWVVGPWWRWCVMPLLSPILGLFTSEDTELELLEVFEAMPEEL